MTHSMYEQNGGVAVTVVSVPCQCTHRSDVVSDASMSESPPSEGEGRYDERFLSRASLLLTDALDDTTRRDFAVRLPLPYLADWCALHLVMLAPDGTVGPLVVCAHVDPQKEPRARALWQRHVQTVPRTIPSLAHVLRANTSSARPARLDVGLHHVCGESLDSPAVGLLERVGLATAVHVPLVAGTHALGVLTFASETIGRYGPRQVALAIVYTSWVAGVLERARTSRHRPVEGLSAGDLTSARDGARRV